MGVAEAGQDGTAACVEGAGVRDGTHGSIELVVGSHEHQAPGPACEGSAGDGADLPLGHARPRDGPGAGHDLGRASHQEVGVDQIPASFRLLRR